MDYREDKIFCELVGYVLNSEGGYVNDPDDPGGPTKCGIAWNYNVGILTEMGFTKATMDKLTPDHARQIYFQKYWHRVGCHDIADKAMAYLVFDTAVNCGEGQAIKMLRQLSKSPKWFEGNGKNKAVWLELFIEYAVLRFRYYLRCKNRKKFIEGWVSRMADVMSTMLKFK